MKFCEFTATSIRIRQTLLWVQGGSEWKKHVGKGEDRSDPPVKPFFSDSMNAIDSCIKKDPFLVPGMNSLASLCAPMLGHKGNHELAWYAEQVHRAAEEHVTIVSNSYYSLICE